MGLIDKILSRVGLQRAARGMNGVSLYKTDEVDGILKRGEPVRYDRLLQEARGYVYACARVIAEEIGMTPFELYQVSDSSNSKEEWKLLEHHDLLDLLSAPNDFMPGFELIEIVSMHLDLTGNAFLWLVDKNGNGVTDDKTPPAAMWPLPPDKIKPVRGPLPGFLEGYVYKEGTTVRRLSKAEVLHIREPNPNDLYLGMGATQAAANAIDLDNWSSEWNRMFFQNGGSMSMALETETNDPGVLQQIRISVDDRHRGVGRAHKIMVLPKGAKLAKESSALSQKDMDFVNLRKMSRDEILALYRVPGTVLGIVNENLNRATADMADYIFARRTIRPKLRRLFNFLNEFLVPRFGENLLLDFPDPVPEDIQAQQQMYKDALAGNPYLSINEVREQQGLGPIEGGDTVLSDPSFVPGGKVLGESGEPNPDEESTETTQEASFLPSRRVRDSRGKTKVLMPSRHVQNSMRRRKIKTDLQAHALEIAAKTFEDLMKRGSIPHKTRDEYVRGTNANVQPMQEDVLEAMRDYHDGLFTRVRANLPGILDHNKDVTQKKIANRQDEIANIIDALAPIMQELSMKQGTFAGQLIGTEIKPETIWNEALRSNLQRMATKYTEETLNELEVELSEGIKAGEGIQKLSERLQELQDGFYNETRATRVATTETFRAANLAAREAWKQTGIIKTLVWHVQSDNPCQFCLSMNGKEVGIDEPFYKLGDIVTGTEGKEMEVDYAAGTDPNLHPNCQCVILPGQIGETQ